MIDVLSAPKFNNGNFRNTTIEEIIFVEIPEVLNLTEIELNSHLVILMVTIFREKIQEEIIITLQSSLKNIIILLEAFI